MSTLYYCPLCSLLTPGWLKYHLRNEHMRLVHGVTKFPTREDPTVPDGPGLAEWHLEQAKADPETAWAAKDLVWGRFESYNQRGPWHLLTQPNRTVCKVQINHPERDIRILSAGQMLPPTGVICPKCKRELEHILPPDVIITLE